jgi:hypothetical protein
LVRSRDGASRARGEGGLPGCERHARLTGSGKYHDNHDSEFVAFGHTQLFKADVLHTDRWNKCNSRTGVLHVALIWADLCSSRCRPAANAGAPFRRRAAHSPPPQAV